MLHFRKSWPVSLLPADPLTADGLRRLLALVLDPRHFLLAPGLALEREHVASRVERWEVFHGRLLDPAHTRVEKSFEEWNLYLVEEGQRSGEPVLSLKLEQEESRLHVVRGILCHVWEAYDSGGGVILSRETTRWVRELTGNLTLAEFSRTEDLLDELVCRVFHVVVGASRLPVTSVETPLPSFSLGQAAYQFTTPSFPPRPRFGGEGSGGRGKTENPLTPDPSSPKRERGEEETPLTFSEERNPLERVKLLGTLLHRTSPEEMPRLAEQLRPVGALPLLRAVFNEVSLSPWTDLVEKSLLLLEELERQGCVTPNEVIDC